MGRTGFPARPSIRISPVAKPVIIFGLAVLGILLLVRPISFLVSDYEFNKGRRLSRQDRTADAKVALRASIERANYYVEPRILLGNLHLADEEYQQAIDVLEPGKSLAPFWPQVQNNIGVAYSQRAGKRRDPGSLIEALAAFERAVAIDATFKEAWLNLGATLLSLRRFEEGEAAFRKALALSPGHPVATSKLAETLAARGEFGEAVELLRVAIEMNPDDANLFSNLGTALLLMGREDEAITQLEKATELDPGLFEPHLNLARLFERRGEIDKAIRHYKIALKIKPDLRTVKATLDRILKSR